MARRASAIARKMIDGVGRQEELVTLPAFNGLPLPSAASYTI